MTQMPYYTVPQQAWPVQRPGAVMTFYDYCVLMVLLYLAVAGLGVFFLANAAGIAADDPEMTAAEARIMGWIWLAVGLFFALVFVVPPLLPRRRWAWIVGIVMISLGLTSCCLWPLCIPLLIYYVQGPTRWWYGMER